MRNKTLLIILCCFSLLVQLEASNAQSDPNLATEKEEDDSARCRHSGIFLACEFPSVDRAERVRDAARWTWKGYKDCAHGWDELRPVSCKGQEWHKLQLTPIDAMDTLALMNLHQEFNEALQLVKDQLNPTEECNVFETTIRILGSLLSTHHIVSAHYNKDIDGGAHESTSLDLLNAAIDVGSRLFRAFNSPSGIPYSDINLSTGSTERSVYHSSMAEATTLSLEFTFLARLTGEETFEKAAMKVHQVLTPSVEKYEGLLPQFVSPSDGSCSVMLQRYTQAIQTVRRKLLRRSTGGLLYIAEEMGNVVSPKMDHLVCFLPGVLALGDLYNISTRIVSNSGNEEINAKTTFFNSHDATDLEIAEQLIETYGGDFMIKENDAHNLLRPETVESLFILWKVTGNKKYQEQAWLIFRAFERWTRVEGVEQCLAVDVEAAAETASREVARVAALEAARALLGRGKSAAEQAIKQGIDAGKAALEAMRLPAARTEQPGPSEGATRTELIANACLSAAEAAARATVQMFVSSNATLTLDDIPDVSKLEEKTASTDSERKARVCDFSNQPGGGYSNLESVKSIPPPRRDKMESFWIAETLKYLYLIFTDPPDRCLAPGCVDLSVDGQQAVLPLTKFVFTTEAHPLPIVGPMESSLIKPVDEIDRKLLNPFVQPVDGTEDEQHIEL
ncbi:hypothetical protein Ndes2437A_g07575 [Nannochloris sp. 'desiccata']